MTEEEKEKLRFVSTGDGEAIERPNKLPNWNEVLNDAMEEKWRKLSK